MVPVASPPALPCTGVQWDVDATRDLLVLEADGGSWLLKGGGTGSPEQPELTPG